MLSRAMGITMVDQLHQQCTPRFRTEVVITVYTETRFSRGVYETKGVDIFSRNLSGGGEISAQ